MPIIFNGVCINKDCKHNKICKLIWFSFSNISESISVKYQNYPLCSITRTGSLKTYSGQTYMVRCIKCLL